jgi:hypothetical protein
VLPVVYQFSAGIPRRINLICSRLMLYAFLAESHTITAEDAQTVVQELSDAELAHPRKTRTKELPHGPGAEGPTPGPLEDLRDGAARKGNAEHVDSARGSTSSPRTESSTRRSS